MNNLAPNLRKRLRLRMLILLSLLPGLTTFQVSIQANPQGPNVRAGNVNFQGLGSANLDINNLSNRAIINWQSFSIDRGEVTRINQANNAFTLNRVVTGNPSAIYGQLKAARGGVALINPNGIVVHQGGVVDVAGMLTMSTLDISDNDFLNGGSNRFRGNSGAGIENYGAISSASGDVVLLGNFLKNAGSVSASGGTVAFGAGGDIVVDHTASGGKISVLAGGPGGPTGIDNSGTISGAAAELKAHGNVYALAIKNDGIVRASGYNFAGGKLTLSAGSRGSIVNTGQLSARNSDGSGGRVEVSGGNVRIGGSVDASGAAGMVGGVVDVSGREVSISDTANISAVGRDGGGVTIAGTNSVDLNGSVDVSSDVGNGGDVSVTAANVNVGASANVDVSGMAAGGTARIGGGIQGSDATIANAQNTTVEEGAAIIADSEGGNAGSVVVWADNDTLYRGMISAQAFGNVGNGGFVEVSGLESLQYFGTVSTMSENGQTGTLLLDPTNVVVGPVGGTGVTISDVALVDAVLQNNVVIHTASPGTDIGNITIQSGANVSYDSPNSLAFFAHGDIRVNGDVKNHGTTDYIGGINVTGVDDPMGTGNITLFAGWDGTGAGLFSFDPQNTGANTGAGPAVSAADILAGTYGDWGNNEGSVYLNSAALERVEVGSARGETNAFGFDIDIRGGDGGSEFAQLGYRRENDLRGVAPTATGTINTATDVDYDDGVVGNINVYAQQDVLLVPNPVTTNEEGVKARDRTYTMIGHGGMREDNDDVDDRPGTDYGSDSGHITVGDGDNSGDITVQAGRALIMSADRAEAFTQIGHGGLGNGTVNGDGGNDGNMTSAADAAYTSSSINGDMHGNISITSGVIDMQAGFYNDAYAMIGNGGTRIRGVHTGDIDVTTTSGGIRVQAAPDSAIGGPGNSNDWRWRNNRDQSFAQIGHGGFDSDYANSVLMPARTVILNTNDGANDTVNNSSVAGDGIQINPETGIAYGHGGDITVTSAGGIEFRAGNGSDAYAMLGHGGRSTSGDHYGDITVEAQNGDIIFDRDADQVNERGRDITERGQRAHVQIGHGGGRYQGGSTGDIQVMASGDIEFYGGRAESYAMVGHGGRGEDSSTWNGGRQRGTVVANGTHSGDISVVAGGDITFRSGFSPRGQSFSMIGHGGFYNSADVVDTGQGGVNGPLIGGGAPDASQEGHNGDITVTAGGDISFKAGADSLRSGQTYMEANAYDAFTQIGHGGRYSKGDHHGMIDITAGGDLEMEARGGWDAVTIENNGGDNNTNELGTPRLNSTEDNGRNGFRNWAQIGHGGLDSTHNDNNATQNYNNSGKEGDGLGLDYGDGVSDITVNVGGDVTLLGAMEATAGPALPIRIIQDNGSGNPNIGDVQNTYLRLDGTTAGTPGQGFSQHYGILDYIERGNGEIWTMPDPVLSAEDSYAMIGNGGRSSDYRGGIDGNGHRGNIVVNAGGSVTVQAGDIEQAVSTNQVLEIQVQNYQDSHGDGTGTGAAAVGTGTIGGDGVYYVGDGIGPNGDAGNFINDDNSQNDGTVGQRNFAQIGLGGWGSRGDHLGDVTVTAENGDIRIIAGEGREDYAQIGTGGYETEGQNSDNERAGDIGQRGDIIVSAGGAIAIEGGGRDGDVVGARGDDPTALAGNDDVARASYAQIGNGGGLTGGNHSGNIDVDAGTGIDILAGSSPRGAYGMVGHGGYWARSETHVGDISVVTQSGNINLVGGIPIVDSEGPANGSGIDNTGQISSARESFAQIGHGGFDADAQGGNQNNAPGDGGFSGDIEVVSVAGNITVRGGGDFVTTANNDNFRGNSAQIGHGGYATDGDHTGDILIGAGGDVLIEGGGATREAYGQIGHGGYGSSGNHGGLIDIDSGGSVVLVRGEGQFNPWAKIGHGAQAFGGRNNNGTGDRDGDITISAGLNFDSTGGLVGHVDPFNDGTLFAYDSGNTYIAVSRNNPFAGGPGQFITDSTTVLSSAGFGVGSELRLYMPDSGANLIAEGTYINSGEYTRTPPPGSGRSDEVEATEHTFEDGTYGEPEGEFTPEGTYNTNDNSFGLYFVYYAGDDPNPPVGPVDPGVITPDPGPEVTPDPIDPGFDFAGVFLPGELGDFTEDDSVLEAGLAGENDGLFDALGMDESEDDGVNRKRRKRLSKGVGPIGLVYYTYTPDTNEYSSYRLFGVEQSNLSLGQ